MIMKKKKLKNELDYYWVGIGNILHKIEIH